MTPLRKWIKKTLMSQIPIGTIWSDTNPAAFKELTGVNQDDLLSKWFQIKDKKPDYNTTGSDPRFTTCSSFLPRFASRVCIAGGLPIRPLHAFALNTERGWTPGWLGDAVAGGPLSTQLKIPVLVACNDPCEEPVQVRRSGEYSTS